MHLLFEGAVIACVIVLNTNQDTEYLQGHWRYQNERVAVIHRLCVSPDFQNKGIGKMSVRYAERMLMEQGYTAIRLDAFSQNAYALRLYESLGYERAGCTFFRKGKFYLYEKRLQESEPSRHP